MKPIGAETTSAVSYPYTRRQFSVHRRRPEYRLRGGYNGPPPRTERSPKVLVVKSLKKLILLTAGLLVVAAIGWRTWTLLPSAQDPTADRGDRDGDAPVPVEVAPIERGPIERRRTFSGTLEAAASFDVAAKVSGRVEALRVDLADGINNGQTVAVLDSDEFRQDLAQAQADSAVAQATLAEATNAQAISDRTMQRQTTLRERGIASDAEFDTTRAQQLAAQAKLAVAQAQAQRAEAAVEAARIRLDYTQVAATWSRGDGQRVVAKRWVDEGDTVAANAPLFTVVDLDPIVAVLFVAEQDYAAITPGLSVALRSDVYPDQTFAARVTRVAPIFESTSRQARVELTVPNPGRRLKPGMFVQAQAILERVEDATIVPEQAITRRADRPVIFTLNETTQTARLVPVELGITENSRVQIASPVLNGSEVVTLGQPLLEDGSAVLLPDRPAQDDISLSRADHLASPGAKAP